MVDDGIRHVTHKKCKREPHVSVLNRLNTNLLLASRRVYNEYKQHANKHILLVIQGHPGNLDKWSLPKHERHKVAAISKIKVILSGSHSGDHALSLLPRWYRTVSRGITKLCANKTLQLVVPLNLWDLADHPDKHNDIIELARRFTRIRNVSTLTILLNQSAYDDLQSWSCTEHVLVNRWTARDGTWKEQHSITVQEANEISCLVEDEKWAKYKNAPLGAIVYDEPTTSSQSNMQAGSEISST